MKSYFRNWNSLTRGALHNFNKLLKYVNVIQFDYARNSSIMDAASEKFPFALFRVHKYSYKQLA